MSTNIAGRIGQYHYDLDHSPVDRVIGGVTFKVGIATAYNAYGLIGSEHNGIFVLDDTNLNVVIDRHIPQQSGYFGPSTKQIDAFKALLALDDRQFLGFLEAHPRFRGVALPEAV